MSKTRAELVRFALAGVAGLAVDVAVLYLALAAGLDHFSGRVLSFLAAVFATWRINRRYTFAGAGAASAADAAGSGAAAAAAVGNAAVAPAGAAAGSGGYAGAAANAGTWGEWWRYLGAMLGGGLVNYLAYSAVITVLPAHPLLPLAAVAAGSVAGMSINFIGAKYFVFNRSP